MARLALAALALALPAARAADLGQAGDFDVRLDTTLRETVGLRLGSPQQAVLADVNTDDGDRAFAHGLTQARTDILAEMTAQRNGLGFDLSADGWYDPMYQSTTQNDSPMTFNPISVPSTQLPAATRRLQGGAAELANAFVQGRFTVLGLPLSLRVGRQTLLWGESLFFASNGIAGGMAPVDAIRAFGAPLATARDLYLPVAQASLRLELAPNLALEAYDQAEWRRDRLPGVGGFFSTTDILDAGGERLLLPHWTALARGADDVPSGFGQFGVALRAQGDHADLGLYALRFDAKLPQPVFSQDAGTYRLLFPTGIDVIGASFSSYAGESNIAGEVSARHDMPLLPAGPSLSGLALGGGGGLYTATVMLPPDLPQTQAAAPPGSIPPRGDTWHAQLSLSSQLPPGRWWQSASLQAEIAANDLIEVTTGHAAVLPGRTHFSASLQAVFSLQYFQVLPGLDVLLPIGLSYTPVGRSSIDSGQSAGAGEVTLSATATFRRTWQSAVSCTHFIGAPSAQSLSDRDFVTVSVARTF